MGGAGGIGSWLTLLLARQGHEIHVYDHDIVSEVNLGGQLFGSGDVGEAKVDSIRRTCDGLADHSISTYQERFTKDSPAAPVMFSCFDNMESRKVMFESWKESKIYQAGASLFIDGRLNAETAEMFCVYDEATSSRWLATWFEDSKVEDAPCTFKATSHCAAILAGLMVAALNNFTANRYAEEQRSVPFSTSIWLPTMTITSEE